MSLAVLELAPPIATLTLNRPDSRNALSIELLEALHGRLDDLGDGRGCHVLILTGAGRAFCAGMDLKQVLSTRDAPARLLNSLADFAGRLRAVNAVTIARVNGAAIGGGCGITTVCDFAITHSDAKMGFPEVDLGVCPAVVAPWLVRKIGAGRARAMLLRGGLLTGTEAEAAGLVEQVVPTLSDLDQAVGGLAGRIASGGATALRATRGLLNELDGSLDGALARRAAELSASVLATPEAQAALRARQAGP